MISVGLTGGIGSGKSTVLAHLERLGACAYEADTIAKEIMARPDVTGAVAKEFGPDVMDSSGVIDHKRLAAVVFKDEARRRALNALIHPLVIDFIESEIERLRQAGECRLAIFEVPLLVEADMLSLFDRIVVVACAPEAQLDRLMARGYGEQGAIARMRAQVPDAERLRHADIILINKGSAGVLADECDRLYSRLLEQATASA